MLAFLWFTASVVLVQFSVGRADECSLGLHNQYPVCSPLYHNFSVSEVLRGGAIILQVNCTDPEGSRMTWRIASGNYKQIFNISQSGLLTVNRKLNAEIKVNPYLLFIEAQDSGTPRLTSTVVVTLFVTSVNDEAPAIRNLPAEVEVPENSPRGTLVTRCTLVDEDTARLPEGLARVRILEGNDDNLFRLDSRTCALSLNKKLDYETMQPMRLLYEVYELDVAAPLKATQNITIIVTDSNDHRPNCTDYVILLTVSEDTQVDAVLTSLTCSDVDVSDSLRYSIAEDSPDVLAVNFTSGEVTLAKPLDFDSNVTNFDVTAIVYDVSSEPLTSTVIINVQILDVDDNVPQFDSDVIQIEANEEWEVGRVIWTLTARDADSPGTPLSTVTYRLLSSQPSWFHVHSTTGTVTIKEPMDREAHPHVLLTVAAHSSDQITATSTVLLNITIANSNNNRPLFNQTYYHCRAKEGTPFGTTVCDVTASDADDNDVVFYTDSDYFYINSSSGQITLTGPLDLESRASYLFVVTAIDADDTNMTSQALVEVEVEGENEAPPIFKIPANDSEIRFVAENTLPGTSLFSVSATDADHGDDGKITYHLLEPPDSPFFVDVTEGDVILRGRLDRETRDNYTLVVEARDSSSTEPRSASVTVTVSVSDVNDNGPVCQHVEPVVVESSVSLGDRLLTLSCSDPDQDNSSLSFAKSSGDISGVFHVDADSGEVKLTRVPTLPRYEVLFEIRDIGSTGFSTFTTVIFIIEDSFKFSNLPPVLNITEDTDVGTVVLDLDTTWSRLTPFFQIKKDQGVFNVEPATGEIYLKTSLDRETLDKYEFTISASTAAGHATTATVTVTVLDANDNAPDILGTFNISVLENVAVPTALQVFSAHDKDLNENSEVSFQIRSGNEGGRFSLTAEGKLSVVQSLDAETQQLHHLVIQATDRGSPALTSERTVMIIVRNVDEFQPHFANPGQNSVHIKESTALGALVVHVTADDADLTDDVWFDLVSGNSDDTFRINRHTGQLFLAKLLDREKRAQFEIVVQIINARKQIKTSLLSITVDDANDNPPTFSKTQYMYEVTDKTPANVKIGDLSVSDRDQGTNADLDLEIVSENSSTFTVEKLSILTNRTVLMSEASSYTFTIRATDRGSPSLSSDVAVIIRVLPENKRPRFSSHKVNITVEENSLTGIKVYDFQATRAGASEGESGDLVYTITSGNEKAHFQLSEITGELYIIRALDYEESQSFVLSVRAQHKDHADLFDVVEVTVYVTNVNDVSPEFERLTYRWRVKEGVYQDTVIGTVEARDGDEGPFGQVRYSMSPDAMFSINDITGEVTVTGQVDYNRKSYFFLPLTATDLAGPASLTGRAAIMVHVTDLNDHAPEFPDVGKRLKVGESTPVGTPLLALLPRDRDSGDNANLTCDLVAGNQEGKFSVDPLSCVLTITASLDAESQTRYDLVVTATDAGSPAKTGTTSLTVDVIDKNDNSPNFRNTAVHVHLKRSDPPGTEVYKAIATDADSGKNGMILYSILSGQTDGTFNIDALTGQVRTLTPLTQADDTYTLLVTATDRGYPPRTATLTLSVEIYPVRNPRPATLNVEVLEHSPVGTGVAVVPWKDASKTVVSHLITSGNYQNVFRVRVGRDGNAVIEVAGSIDREVYPVYQLVIDTVSRDSTGANFTDSTVVKIEVADVNDHAPVFANPGLDFSFVENLPVGTTVAKLDITDEDVGSNADVKISFAKSSSLCDKHFTLTSGGHVVIKEPPDYEALILLTCEVVARDGGSPPKISTSTFRATVMDIAEKRVNVIGEGASVFLSLEIPSDSSPGRLVSTLSTSHFGILPLQRDSVSFLSLNQDGVFTVSTATGEVRLGRKDLLYDKSRYFQWMACRHESGGVVNTQLAMLRVDAFSMDKHVVALSVEANREYVRSMRTLLQSRLQTFFGSGSRLEILEIRENQGTSARRRVLEFGTVALVYVVNNTVADEVGGVDKDKPFMGKDDVLKVLQALPDGTPVTGIRDKTLPVVSVMPYHNSAEDDPAHLIDTVEGLALILVLLLFLVVVIIVFVVCCLWRVYRKKTKARKDSMTILRNDSISDRSQDTPSPQPPKKNEVDNISILTTEPDEQEAPRGRRMTLVIKEELDSLLPLPPMLTQRVAAQQTPPSATAHAVQLDPAPHSSSLFLTKQAALTRLIEEKKKEEKEKEEETKEKKKTRTMLLKGKASGKVGQSPATTPRFPGHLRSEDREEVQDIEDSPDEATAVPSFLASPSSPSVQRSPMLQAAPSDTRLQTVSQSPVLTTRSVHVQPVEAWTTADGSKAKAKRQAAAEDTAEGDTAGKSEGEDPDSPKEGQASGSRKPGIFASILAALGRKQSTHQALASKRASMPVTISEGESRRLSRIAMAGGGPLTTTENRDVGEMNLEDSEILRQTDRPDNISTIRRQSLFV